MQRPLINRYWLFQLAGWGTYVAITLFMVVFILNQFSVPWLQHLLFFVEIGIIFTHIMREVIRSTQLLIKSIQ